jgi:hypothetical protein
VRRIRTEELNPYRAFDLIEVEIIASPLIPPAPYSLQSCRKILSDTPAIGAR